MTEPGLLSKARGRQNENLFAQIPRCELCRKVLGYDANALYPRTMLGDMPCGKEVVVHWPQTPGNVEKFCRFLQ